MGSRLDAVEPRAHSLRLSMFDDRIEVVLHIHITTISRLSNLRTKYALAAEMFEGCGIDSVMAFDQLDSPWKEAVNQPEWLLERMRGIRNECHLWAR